MARPRAATDEEIIAAADQLAEEIGWQNVYAKTVHEHMSVGGSLSTFSKPIKAWRADKEAEAGAQGTQVTKVVEDRASVLDNGLGAIADTLKKLRQTMHDEIDRAVADERRKSERLRTDDRVAHERVAEDLRSQILALNAEIDDLVAEAQTEADRADQAEADAIRKGEDLGVASKRIAILDVEARKIPDLSRALDEAKAEIQKVTAEADVRDKQVRQDAQRQIEKSEAREAAAQKTISDRDIKIEKLERNLSQTREDLATARSDLTNARAERAGMEEKLKSAEDKVARLETRIESERTRADSAWDRVRELQDRIPAPKEAPASTRHKGSTQGAPQKAPIR